eukprot:70157-Pleurochrysis_carterae.AAC.1
MRAEGAWSGAHLAAVEDDGNLVCKLVADLARAVVRAQVLEDLEDGQRRARQDAPANERDLSGCSLHAEKGCGGGKSAKAEGESERHELEVWRLRLF